MGMTLYNLLEWNNQIMDDIVVPDGIDKSVLVDTISFEYGEYDLIHSNPKMFYIYNNQWWKRKLWMFQKLYDSMNFEYDPIENYRRYEDGWENNDDTENRTRNQLNNRDRNLNDDYSGQNKQDENRNTNTTSNSTTTDTVAAYNSSSWSNADQHTTNGSGNEKVTDGITGSNSYNRNEGEKINDTLNETNNLKNLRNKKYGILAHGNIGVTTSQQMIEQEREVSRFDIYREMADLWAKDFCVLCI